MMVSSYSHNARLNLVLILSKCHPVDPSSVRNHSRSPLHSTVVPDSSSGEDDCNLGTRHAPRLAGSSRGRGRGRTSRSHSGSRGRGGSMGRGTSRGHGGSRVRGTNSGLGTNRDCGGSRGGGSRGRGTNRGHGTNRGRGGSRGHGGSRGGGSRGCGGTNMGATVTDDEWTWETSRAASYTPPIIPFTGALPAPAGIAVGVTDPLQCFHFYLQSSTMTFYSRQICMPLNSLH